VEIKYRAWDEDNQKMWYWEVGDIDNEFWNAVRVHGHIPMQFSGRHGKNGVELYPGDIVNWNGEPFNMCIIFHCGAFLAIASSMEYKDGQRTFFPNCLYGSPPWEEFDLVGNTLENLELLKNGAGS